jgi:hypothetical protein
MFVEAEEGKERRAAPKEAWAKPDFYVAAPVCKGFGTEFAALVDKTGPNGSSATGGARSTR